MPSDYKTKAVALLKAIETGDAAPVGVINPAKYTQHNLAVGDGLAGFGAALQALPKGSAKVNTVRVFQDGDFVFAHTDYNFFGPKIGFDVFRFEDGKIVEHWDNLQETPTSPNPSGHTMLDGPVQATDLTSTEANKKLVTGFVTDVLLHGCMDSFNSYVDPENYTQHNPKIGDGLAGLKKGFEARAQAGQSLKYDRLFKVLGEGNFVLAISEGHSASSPIAFYDLFRVANGKIVEHWDTVEAIPERAAWRNQNGKFQSEAEVIEVVTLKLKPGVTVAEFKPVDHELGAQYVSKQPGFISRESAAADNGDWLVIVHWRSVQDADASMEAFERAPGAAAFMANIDASTMTMKRYSK